MPKKKAFLLRIQPDLWEELSRWAADEFRSVNGHIEYLLRQSVRQRRSSGRERQGLGKGGPGTTPEVEP